MPLMPEHYSALFDAAADSRIWKTHHQAYHIEDIFRNKWFEPALAKMASGKRIAFSIESKGVIIGSSSFYEIDEQNKRLSIGYTWFNPEHWGSGVNTIAKLLMLECTFETFGFKRVNFCIDEINTRSRKAVEKLGAQFEGIIRKHIIRPDGSERNSAIYSVIDSDWPTVKNALKAKLRLTE